MKYFNENDSVEEALTKLDRAVGNMEGAVVYFLRDVNRVTGAILKPEEKPVVPETPETPATDAEDVSSD